MSCTGATPPNVPNYTKATYADWLDNTKFDSAPPPYFDDGTAGVWGLFATNTAALASGSAGTAGGTENTYPGAANGVVPASTSVPHEAAGTETSVTNPGNIAHSYTGPVTFDTSKMYGVGPALPTPTVAAPFPASINGAHASTLSPAYASNPTLASITLGSSVSGTGTTLLTCTGTNFVQGCRIWVNNVEQTTTWVSATSLTATINKKPQAGTWPVDVKLGGVAVPSTRTITWT